MHSRLRLVVVAVLALVGSLIVSATPAWACPWCQVEPTEDGLLGRVRSQVNELNRYESQPTPCTERDEDGPNPEVTGFLRWRLARVAQDQWLDALNADSGIVYRLECWAPEAGEFGGYVDVRLFPDINAENLARLAMDEFLLGLPAPEPHLNPAVTTLVNIDTWLTVDNIPAGSITAPPISVPGITVVMTATAGGVLWTMGDGGERQCPGIATGSQCSYTYTRSSAGQAGGQFHGNARVVWLGTYTVNGAQADAEFPVARQSDFSIAVAEGQAVVVG
jgi:hypothetical protein